MVPWRRRESGVIQWDPFREIEEMHDRMGRLLETTFGGVARPMIGWSPLADIEETEDAWMVEAELPGVSREDVNVELRGGEIAITGEMKERERKGVLRRQTRRTGRFEYRITLPGDVEADKIEASLNSGVLTVRVPKVPQVQPKRIEVKGGG